MPPYLNEPDREPHILQKTDNYDILGTLNTVNLYYAHFTQKKKTKAAYPKIPDKPKN
jgi:hypothetical protein